MIEVPPSPNDHTQDVGAFVEESMNWMVRGMVPEDTVVMNDATGAVATLVTVMYPVWETVVLPPAFVAVRVTVNVPAVAYVYTGFCSVDVPPSPNDHAQPVGEFVEESTNWTERGSTPEVMLETNAAVGAAVDLLTVMYPVRVTVSLPAVLDAVRLTV